MLTTRPPPRPQLQCQFWTDQSRSNTGVMGLFKLSNSNAWLPRYKSNILLQNSSHQSWTIAPWFKQSDWLLKIFAPIIMLKTNRASFYAGNFVDSIGTWKTYSKSGPESCRSGSFRWRRRAGTRFARCSSGPTSTSPRRAPSRFPERSGPRWRRWKLKTDES